MGEVWAVVGSRDYPDLGAVRQFVQSLPSDATVVSGGARGVDITAELAATSRGLTVESWRPRKDADGRWRVVVERTGELPEWRLKVFRSFPHAAFWRNEQIVARADRVKAFWDGKSRGTAHTRELARSAGKLADD